MMTVPVSAVGSQTLETVLSGQSVTLAIYQKGPNLYADISLNGAALVTATICRDRVPLVRRAYLGFIGDLVFVDTQGVNDPTYDGLGSRYLLVYLEAGDQ